MDVSQLLSDYENARRISQISDYKPYPYQEKFHKAGLHSSQILVQTGNRCGKTYCGAAELTFHLTGLYPIWWEGRRFEKPVKAWAAGTTNDKTRDILQNALCGTPGDPQEFGTGSIPKELIVRTVRKPGVPNAFMEVHVKHTSGRNSKVAFKAYEMGQEGFMGESLQVVWLDEEPPQNIYTQCITRTADSGGLTYMTFTPESGMTDVVAQFANDIRPGQTLITATWNDISTDNGGHLSPDVMAQLLSAYPPHERDMRTKGIPVFGSGLVFSIPEEDLYWSGELEKHWPRICGMDFGWEHPTAAVWGAWDRDSDTVYIYDAYRQSHKEPIYHAAKINANGKWIPVVWPHDGLKGDGKGGSSLRRIYKDLDVNMLQNKFSNPPTAGQKEGQGGIQIEPGIMEMMNRMKTGRFKVDKNLTEWFEEYRMYHRKEGKIVDVREDLMSATRYLTQSLRFARVNDRTVVQFPTSDHFQDALVGY